MCIPTSQAFVHAFLDCKFTYPSFPPHKSSFAYHQLHRRSNATHVQSPAAFPPQLRPPIPSPPNPSMYKNHSAQTKESPQLILERAVTPSRIALPCKRSSPPLEKRTRVLHHADFFALERVNLTDSCGDSLAPLDCAQLRRVFWRF